MNIESIVKNLNPDYDASQAELALQLVRDALTFFQGPVDYSKLDQNLGLIFAENNGLLVFMRKKICVKEFEHSKVEAFSLISWLMQQKSMKSYVYPFCGRFKTICSIYWNNKKESAKTQQAAVDTLIALFEGFGTDIDLTCFDAYNLYHELTTSICETKFAPSVRGKMINLLGTVASLFSDYFDKAGVFERLFNLIMFVLKKQVDSVDMKMEPSIILGVMKAMDSILLTHGTRVVSCSDNWTLFCVKLEQIVNPEISIVNTNPENKKLKRREFQRAAIDLIANHGASACFSKMLYDKYNNWFEDLLAWSSSRNADDSRVGKRAMYSFLQAITAFIKANTKNKDSDEEEKKFQEKVIKFFIERFNTSLANKDCSRNELIIAVKGAGWLLDVCSDSVVADNLFSKVMTHIEVIVAELNMPVTDKYNGSLGLMTTYLESVGSMLHAAKITDDTDEDTLSTFQQRLMTVEQLSSLLIINFPNLGEKSQPFAHLSFLKVIHGLYGSHHKYFLPFVERVFNETLNHIIASPTKLELDILTESFNQGDIDRASYSAKNNPLLKPVSAYAPFWVSLMKARSPVTEALYDAVIRWTLATIGKLDLSLEFIEDPDSTSIETISADPIYNIKPNVIRDFQLFVNLVDFLQEFVLKANAQLFTKWIEFFVDDMMGFLKNNPLISGFYKILSVVFQMTDRVGYFEEDISERKTVFANSTSFLKGLGVRIAEFRDDLLLSVLELWLSAPDKMIMENINSLHSTSQIVFVMGRNHFPLALRGIETIDRWLRMNEFPTIEMEKLVENLFPIWKSYFVSAGEELNAIHDEKEKRLSTKTQSKSKIGQRRVRKAREEFDNATLKNVQLKLLHLFGSYGHLIKLGDEIKNALSTEEQFLKYSLPFQDIKPDIYFDKLLPRILDLCHTASDRQTRSCACEFFHTVILYFLGFSVKTTGSSDHGDLFKLLFKALLKFGCDSDSVVRQLFNPLAIQVVHWFTRKDNPYSENMLRIIMDGLTQSNDAPLRDFSGVCLTEYFSWVIKHDNKADVNSVMNFLFALSTHAAPQYRQGSVLGFNSIYKDFRENDNLRNVYTMQLMYSYVTCLALSNSFGADTVLIRSAILAIKHLERIILKKQDLFNTEIKQRKKPDDVAGHSLKHFVDWLLKQTGRIETICRQECIRLVSTMGPIIRGMGTLQQYLRSFQPEELRLIGERQRSENASLEDSLAVVQQATEYYKFVADSCYPLEKLVNHVDSTYIQDFDVFIQNLIDDLEPKLGNVAINIFLKLQNISKHFPQATREKMVLKSVILSKRFANPTEIEHLCKLWSDVELSSNTVTSCAATVNFDCHKITKNNIMENLTTVRWMTVITKGGFIDTVLGTNDIKLLREKVWNFILDKLFRKRSDGSLETIPISLRMTELLQGLLELCIALKLESDKLTEILFDPTSVSSKDEKALQKFARGEIFQKALFPSIIFCEDVMNLSILKDKVSMENVGNLAQNLLQAVKMKRNLRKQFGPLLVENILAIWTPLQLNCDRRIVARILSGLASIDLNLCRNSLSVSQWWSNTLTLSYLSLKDKSEIIHLFGLFALSTNKQIVTDVISAVNLFIGTSITSQMKWTEEENYITRITLKILSVYEKIPKNMKLLEVLARLVGQISCMQGATDNSCAKEIQYKLRKIVPSLADDGNDIANHLYQLVTNKQDATCRQTLAACKICLISVVSSLPSKTVKKFYKKNFYSIIHNSKSTPTTVEEWNLKITGLYLLELLALKTDKEFLISEEFNQSYMANWTDVEKKENGDKIDKIAIRHFIAICGKYKSTNVPSQRDENVRKANFQSNGASFNALVAILRVTTIVEKLYSAYIFQETKNDVLWANLVDSNINFNFPVILPQQEAKKQETKLSTNKVATDEPKEKRIAVITNKDALVGSSLAMEATEYDFTASVTVENSEFYKSIFAGAAAKSDGQNSQQGSSIERNEVNQLECMISLVEILKHMKSFDSALDEDGSLIKDRWITNLRNYFNKRPHKNVQIFLIGAILNCEDVIRPYANHFIEPILESIFSECYGEEKLNYFVKDIFIMLLGFHEVAKPCSTSVKKTLEYLINSIGVKSDITNPYATRKDVYEHNLEILRSVVKYWVSDPTNEFDAAFFTGRDYDNKKYLDVCKYTLLGGQLPVNLDYICTFLDRICKGFTHGSKDSYATAGQVIGLVLNYLADINYDHMQKAVSFVKSKLDKQSNPPSKYLIILSAIQKNYPPFVETQRVRLFEFFQKKNVRSEAIILLPALLEEIIRKQDEEKTVTQDFYSDLIGKHVIDTPCKEESEIKAGVELFKLLLPHIDNMDKIMKLVQWTSSALFSKDSDLRVEYAKLLSAVYTQLPGAQQGISLTPSHKSLLKMFVNLYNDEDEKVIEESQKFWAENLQRWNKSSELILELMELIGDDENAIPISLELIMKRCAFSPDFSKKIFDKPLADCQFQEYKLDTSWRMKNSSFQPLFAESLSSSQNFSLLPRAFQTSILSQRQGTAMRGMNLLRATLANLQFTPTNKSSLDNSSLDEDSMMEVDYSFSQDNSVEMLHEASPQQSSNPLANLRRRFYERPPADTNYYARREVQRQERQIEKEFDTVKRKQSGVKLSRMYRIGELPDIEITNSDLLATVSKLARSDQELGRQFLVILYTSIVEEIRDLKPKKQFLDNSEITFNRVFKNYSSVMNPQFAAAVLEISERNSIPIQPSLVSCACRKFDLQKLGIIKFECDLECKDFHVASASKRIRNSANEENSEADLWLRIADLYKDIEGFDVLRNIFSVATNKSVNSQDVYKGAKEALTLESVGKLEKAYKKYSEILKKEQRDQENNSVLREQFWEDSMNKCLEKMSEWEKLFELAHDKERSRHLNDLLEDTNYVERVLPIQIRSGVQMLLRDQRNEENVATSDFKEFIESAQGTEENWNILLERFPVDLAILTAVENSSDISRCGTLLDNTWSSALKYVQNFDRLSYPQKKDQLLILQKSAALQDVLDWYKQFDIETVTDKTFRLVMKWKRSCGSYETPLTNADVIVAQRDFFLLKLGQEVEDLMLNDNDHIFQDIQLLNFHQHLWELNLCIVNENYDVWKKCLMKIQLIGHDLEENQKILYRKLYAKHLETFMTIIHKDQWASSWSSIWKKIRDLKITNEIQPAVWEIKSDLLKSFMGFYSNGTVSAVCEDHMKKAFLGKEKSNSKSLIEVAVDRSLKLVDSAVFDNENMKSDVLAIKFYHLLKLIMSSYSEKCSNEEQINGQLLSSLLRGMQLGSSEGIRLFPSLFSILEKWPSLMSRFETMGSEVPSWMFLPWLDQIVTNYLQTPSLTGVLQSLIDRLVAEFPQAFQLQYPEILAKSKLPKIYSLYSKALSALVLPKHRFKYVSQFNEHKRDSKTLLRLVERFHNDLKEILDDGLCIFGKVHKDYAEELFPKVLDYLERLKSQESSNDDKNAPTPNLTDAGSIKDFCSEIETASKTLHLKVRGRNGESRQLNLSDFSPWLAKFHFSGFKDGIEIPGLYDSFSAPNVQMHPQIISFQPTVTIESSLSEPISFTMMSNEGENYKFLAKFGDDLRQDRRIQQCFRLSNEIFKNSPRCRDRKLHIMTYSVLPFSEDFGLIQWVQKTISMNRIVFPSKSVQRKDMSMFLRLISMAGQPKDKPLSPKITNDHYWTSANNTTKEDATQILDKCIREFNALKRIQKFRDFFKQRAASVEDYFLIRENVIRSYATMCIVHWLLGIGDRHLDNFIFSLETGLCIGIDFGRSFGYGINQNPIPELIPFRLTPELQTILVPYGPKGLFKETMLYAWRALRQSSEQILSVVEVFVRDRGVNWLKESRAPTEEESEVLVPVPAVPEILEMNEMKLKVVKDKLSCLNPIKITENELKLHRSNTVKQIYTKVLKEGRELQLEKEKLSEEEVIDVLLDIATDKSILAKLFAGMNPWI